MSASRLSLIVLGTMVILQLARPAQAQFGGGMGGRGVDPQAIKQTLFQAAQTQLGASDDEMAVIRPKLEKVMQAKLDAGDLAALGLGGRAAQIARLLLGANTPAAQASDALQRTIDDKSSSPTDIATKLRSLREARQQARQDLAKAQGELRDLLTARQEATLVMWGVLD